MTRSFSDAGQPIYGRRNHTAVTLPDGTVLVRGGFGQEASTSAEVYAPHAKTFSVLTRQLPTRYMASATLLANGQVLITGGTSGFDVLASTEVYNPNSGAFKAGATMNTPRIGSSLVGLQNGSAVVIGGRGDAYSGCNAVASVEAYFP